MFNAGKDAPGQVDASYVRMLADAAGELDKNGFSPLSARLSHKSWADVRPATPAPNFPYAPWDPAAMLFAHRSLLERIRLALGDRALWDEHALPLILAWAAMVQALPRGPRGVWCEAGGLFVCGLTTGLRALESIDGSVIGRGLAPEAALAFEKRMRFAAFLLGLWSERGTLSRVEVRRISAQACRGDCACGMGGGSENGGTASSSASFEPAVGTLLEFALEALEAGDVLSFAWRAPAWSDTAAWIGFEAWAEGDAREDAAAGWGGRAQAPLPMHAFLHLMPPETYVWLKAAPPVLTAMQKILEDAVDMGQTTEGRLLLEAQTAARRRTTDERARSDARRFARRPEASGWAVLVRHALDTLFAAGLADFNPRNGGVSEAGGTDELLPVWWAADGLWLAWPEGIDRVLRAAARDQRLRSLPDDLDLIAAVLVEEGIAVPGPDGSAVHSIRLPAELCRFSSNETAAPEALLLAAPNRLIERWRAAHGGRSPDRIDLRLRASPLEAPGVDLDAASERVRKKNLEKPEIPNGVSGAGRNAAAKMRPEGFRFRATYPAGMPRIAQAAFEGAFEEIARVRQPHRWVTPWGVFLPLKAFLPEAADTAFEAAARLGFIVGREAVLKKSSAGRGNPQSGCLSTKTFRMSAADCLIAACRTNEDSPETMIGVIVPHPWIRPMLCWADGTASEARWPAPGIRVLEVDFREAAPEDDKRFQSEAGREKKGEIPSGLVLI